MNAISKLEEIAYRVGHRSTLLVLYELHEMTSDLKQIVESMEKCDAVCICVEYFNFTK